MPPFDASRHRLLAIDDHVDVLEALRLLLKPLGYQFLGATTPDQALEALAEKEFSVVLSDMNFVRDTTSGAEGLELLPKFRAIDPTLPVVVMTAWGNIEIAVEAMRLGARDFITKPWEKTRLLATLQSQIEFGETLRANRRLIAENAALRDRKPPPLLAESAAMRPVLEVISRVGPSDASVLITGENGTGKGVVAEALHAVSTRADRALLALNMGGIPEGLFESELFGHVRGAFTDAKADRAGRFELADGGTLFLDEIGNLSLIQQAKLLRTLESGEFERVGASRTQRANVRIIAATNTDLEAAVARGAFRQDLLFRLNTIHLHLPPLRERLEDIPLLAQHFLERHRQRYGKGSLTGFSPAALEAMRRYRWPGNVRELNHAIERAVLMATERVIQPTNLGLAETENAASPEAMSLEEVERLLIRKALARCEGNARRAAEELGLSRSAMYRRMEKYGL